MPQRFLKPGITNSERWNGVSWQAQSLYIRLLTVVDDYGRYDGRSAVIHGICFSLYNAAHPERPVQLQETDKMLQEIAASLLIELYDSQGKRVMQITQWTERLREGVKEKWPARNNGELLQLPAETCKFLPSPSPSPSTSSPPSSPLVLEVQCIKTKPVIKTDDQWIDLLQRSEGYRELNVREQYSRCGIWCQTNRKHLTKRRFIAWLNNTDKPLAISANGNGNGHLAPIDKSILLDNRKRYEARLATLRRQYDGHQTWDPKDSSEAKDLKQKIAAIDEKLNKALA